jgi:aldehyde:ferredoxin oxidoreductase
MNRNYNQLPSRFYNEPLESGKVITQDDMERLLQDYYHARGWDERGIPPGEYQ